MDQFYNRGRRSTTAGWPEPAIESGWKIYPVWPVDEHRTCTCGKRENCGSPGKHPSTPHGTKNASSDPLEIAEMFGNRPGANIGLATGKGSGVVALDVDSYSGGGQSLKNLQDEHGKLPPTRIHQSGSTDLHYFFEFPDHLDRLPSRTIAPGIEVKADNAGLILPPSRSSYGEYIVLIEGPIAPLPRWITDAATTLQVIEGDGPEPTPSKYVLPERIVESSPSRNRELYGYGCSLRAHQWDHASILAELRKVNAWRCIPPMSDAEVRAIARSASSHDPGSASYVSSEVLQTVDSLAEKARGRAAKGLGGRSRWSVYRALLDTARAHGRMHEGRDVAVNISVRQLALAAGVSKPTVFSALRALEKSGLVYRISAGQGSSAGDLVLRVARRRAQGLTTRATLSVSQEREETAEEEKVKRTALYGLRHKYGIGKVKGAILEVVVESGEVTRVELAEKLGSKPESLRRHLRELVEIGLIERISRGRYRAAEGWRRILERERVLSGEARSERLDAAQYEREREAYRQHLAEMKRKEKNDRT